MVRVTVMTFGEEGNGVHMPALQALLKLLRVEIGADAFDVLAGVKIEMHLPETQNIGTHE